MKIFATLMSAAMGFTTAVQAEQVSGSKVQVNLPSPILVSASNSLKLSNDDLRQFQGQYTLEDGKTLTLKLRGHRLYADLLGQDEVELVAISPTAFITKNGGVKLTFRQAANGNVFGVQLLQSGGKPA